MNWNIENLASVVSGDLITLDKKAVGFTSISTDTRTIEKGALYIAIKGDNFDGHDFIKQAFEKGAVVALVSKKIETNRPLVVVEDTRIALGVFASWHRQQIDLKKLIAITGSNGKTTCKNMVQHLLSSLTNEGKVLATEGNFNNDFGVPRTLLNLKKQHEFAVIEMGANHPKEIDYVSQLALPDVALITLAAGVHLEGFGSLDGVVETKSEIMNGLSSGGTVILNADSYGFDFWQALAAKKSLKVLTFGKSKKATFQLLAFKQHATSLAFSFSYNSIHYHVNLPLLGEHNALNALASLAVCEAVGFDIEALIPPLAIFSGVKSRLQAFKLPNGLLLDDTYNASPSSMKAGIDALVSNASKSIFCMGDMGEIGKDSIREHQSVANYAKEKGVSFLLCCGEETKDLPNIFGEGSFWFETKQALAEKAIQLINSEQAESCLVKGSRFMKMEEIVNTIIKGTK